MVANSTKTVQIFMLSANLHHESPPVKSWHVSLPMDVDILASIEWKLATAAQSGLAGLPGRGLAAARGGALQSPEVGAMMRATTGAWSRLECRGRILE